MPGKPDQFSGYVMILKSRRPIKKDNENGQLAEGQFLRNESLMQSQRYNLLPLREL